MAFGDDIRAAMKQYKGLRKTNKAEWLTKRKGALEGAIAGLSPDEPTDAQQGRLDRVNKRIEKAGEPTTTPPPHATRPPEQSGTTPEQKGYKKAERRDRPGIVFEKSGAVRRLAAEAAANPHKRPGEKPEQSNTGLSPDQLRARKRT